MMTIDRRLASPLLAALLILGSLRPALAAEASGEPDYARTGPYWGMGMVYGTSELDLEEAQNRLGDATVSDSPSFGVDVRGGYRFHPHFAAEADFQWLAGFDIDQSQHNIGSVEAYDFTANGKAYVMTERLQPYFIGGVGMIHVNTSPSVPGLPDSTTGFAGRVGAGADYYIWPNLLVNIEFSAFLPAGHASDIRYLPLVAGVQYRY